MVNLIQNTTLIRYEVSDFIETIRILQSQAGIKLDWIRQVGSDKHVKLYEEKINEEIKIRKSKFDYEMDPVVGLKKKKHS